MNNDAPDTLPVPEPTGNWLNLQVALELTRLWYAEHERPGPAVLTHGPEGLWLHRRERSIPVGAAGTIHNPGTRFVVASGEVTPIISPGSKILRTLIPLILMVTGLILFTLLTVGLSGLIVPVAGLALSAAYLWRHSESIWSGSVINLPEQHAWMAGLREAEERSARTWNRALKAALITASVIALILNLGSIMALAAILLSSALTILTVAYTVRTDILGLSQQPPLRLSDPRALIRGKESLEEGIERALNQVSPVLSLPEPAATPAVITTEQENELPELDDPERLAAQQQIMAVMAQLRALAAHAPEGGGPEGFRLRQSARRAEDMMRAARHPTAQLKIARMALQEARRDLATIEEQNDARALDSARRYYKDAED